ncbi:MAG: DUF3108 domain-containing protein [Gammaproteobacteria bacterium]|nr:DUF3108 domain-containing protein [Gammaproteobacteria bacterium]
MRVLTTALLGMICAIAPLTLYAADAQIPDFTARYVIKKAGLNVIATTISLTRGPENIVYRSEAEPIGMASWFVGDHRIYEQALLEQVDGQVIPLTYRYTHQRSDENRNEYYRYNWTGHVARTNYRGTPRTFRIPDGTLDNFTLQLALIQDAQNGRKTLTYPVISKGELKTYTFTSIGQETIETPLGEFDTVKLERRKEDEENTTYTTWYAAELKYLPVQVENREDGDVVLSLLLDEVEWR